MNRRQRTFVPGSEDLETRQLLSGAGIADAPTITEVVLPTVAEVASSIVPRIQGGPAAQTGQSLSPALLEARQEAIEQAIETRLERIERLPLFLQALDPDRTLPDTAVATIQGELSGLIGQLRPPVEPVAVSFLNVLRDGIARASIQESTVMQLNTAVTFLFQSAEVPDASIERIVGALTEIAQSDVFENQPVVLLTNDYALVVQTVLGVGRPIPAVELLSIMGVSPLAFNSLNT